MSPIAHLHKEIYDFLMEYHHANPDFYFFPRRTRGVRNWENGYLMGGNDDSYLTIGLYKPSDRLNQTQTISIFIDYKHNRIKSIYLLISFRDSTLQPEIPFYNELIDRLKNIATVQKERENQYQLKFDNPEDWRTCLLYYFEQIRPIIEEFIFEKSKQKDFLIEELNFTELSQKISNSLKINDSNISFIKTNIHPMPHYPLNQILYGPPGTGKTYQTVALAYKIVHHLPLEGEIDYTMARTWYKQELAKGHDRQVEFITFHQNYSYEDFIAGIKPALNDDTLGFREHKGIFFEVCQRALTNLIDSQKPIEVIKQEKGIEELFEGFKNHINEVINTSENHKLELSGNVYTEYVFDDAFSYSGENWQHQLRMKFTDILKIYNNPKATNRKEAGSTPDISRTAKEHITYFFKMVNLFKEFTQNHNIQENNIQPVSLKNYVLIIDEINRANISRVFGELITLLEEDKRWGNDFETEVLLPDGFTKFTVPKNLYIIGTMNTADKSIALLDIALRRRFEFIPLYPDASMVKDDYQVFFNTLNQIIKDKKGIDFCIGHAYFMPHQGRDFDFVKVMNQKVIPLLTEYFYNARTTQNDVKQLLEEAFSRSGLSFQIEENMFQIMIVGS